MPKIHQPEACFTIILTVAADAIKVYQEENGLNHGRVIIIDAGCQIVSAAIILASFVKLSFIPNLPAQISSPSAPSSSSKSSFLLIPLLGLYLRLDFRIPEVIGTVDDGASQPLDRELGDVKLTLIIHQRSHDLGDTSLDDVDVVLQNFLALAAHRKVLVETILDLAGQVALAAVEETGVDVMAAELVVVGGEKERSWNSRWQSSGPTSDGSVLAWPVTEDFWIPGHEAQEWCGNQSVVLSSQVNECFLEENLGLDAEGDVDPDDRAGRDGFEDVLAFGKQQQATYSVELLSNFNQTHRVGKQGINALVVKSNRLVGKGTQQSVIVGEQRRAEPRVLIALVHQAVLLLSTAIVVDRNASEDGADSPSRDKTGPAVLSRLAKQPLAWMSWVECILYLLSVDTKMMVSPAGTSILKEDIVVVARCCREGRENARLAAALLVLEGKLVLVRPSPKRRSPPYGSHRLHIESLCKRAKSMLRNATS
ncbi:hypothetical protein KCU61_g774, partial [Aureobasidium melanogenum]